jgi:acyl-CoA synthetase (AMP-forming)/AMP-acid ligase II
VLRSGAAATALELRRFAATRLAPFKVPRRILFLEAIPRTATGKPQRALLAERFRNRTLSPGVPPPAPLEANEARPRGMDGTSPEK